MRKKEQRAISRILMSSTVFALASIDQALKAIVERYQVGQVIFRLAPLFEIVHTVNPGAAFSIFSGLNLILLLATTAMLLFLVWAIFFCRGISVSARWCMVVLLGGGVGNWVDRVDAAGVTDYIRTLFISFPVFNFADVCITVSVIALIVLLCVNRFDSETEV